MIAIIDYDIGNLAAVANMLRRIGVRAEMTASPDLVESASKIILPGNGSFDACVRNLKSSGLLPILEHKVMQQKTPLLGICVGAQMLGMGSEEGIESGLGWIDMRVRRFPSSLGIRVPHMGWNQVTPVTKNYLTEQMATDARFYFVHSYYMEVNDKSDQLLSSTYGVEFASGVARDNICGVQFHPEKSHRFGKQLLTAFANG